MTLQDMAYRLITDRITEVLQGTLNTVIAPRAILSCHADYQVFNLFAYAGTSNRWVWLGSAHLVVGKPAVPGKDSISLGHGGDFFQRLLAQLGAHLSEFFALTVGELHTTIDLVAQDAILRQEISIAKPQVVADRLRDGFQ